MCVLIVATFVAVVYFHLSMRATYGPSNRGLMEIAEDTSPLVYAFVAVVLPTLLVWRFWPKPPKPGHCRCAYNLTGNTSGVCPECGVEVQR